jgi:hypothetical protein
MEESSSTAPPRRWYQFSLREILLATVALSAVLALIVNNPPFAPTDFFESFDAGQLINRLNSQHKLGLASASTSGSTFRADGRSNRSFEYSTPTPDDNTICQQLMPSLYDEIKQQLADTGCRIEGRSIEGIPHGQLRSPSTLDDQRDAYDQIREFSFTYQSGAVRGKIQVWALEGPKGETRLRIETDEW